MRFGMHRKRKGTRCIALDVAHDLSSVPARRPPTKGCLQKIEPLSTSHCFPSKSWSPLDSSNRSLMELEHGNV